MLGLDSQVSAFQLPEVLLLLLVSEISHEATSMVLSWVFARAHTGTRCPRAQVLLRHKLPFHSQSQLKSGVLRDDCSVRPQDEFPKLPQFPRE